MHRLWTDVIIFIKVDALCISICAILRITMETVGNFIVGKISRRKVVTLRFSIITKMITISFSFVLFNLMEIILLHVCVLNQNVSLCKKWNYIWEFALYKQVAETSNSLSQNGYKIRWPELYEWYGLTTAPFVSYSKLIN